MTQNPPLRFAWMEELSLETYIFFFNKPATAVSLLVNLKLIKKKKAQGVSITWTVSLGSFVSFDGFSTVRKSQKLIFLNVSPRGTLV